MTVSQPYPSQTQSGANVEIMSETKCLIQWFGFSFSPLHKWLICDTHTLTQSAETFTDWRNTEDLELAPTSSRLGNVMLLQSVLGHPFTHPLRQVLALHSSPSPGQLKGVYTEKKSISTSGLIPAEPRGRFNTLDMKCLTQSSVVLQRIKPDGFHNIHWMERSNIWRAHLFPLNEESWWLV